ncbi:hypothetical protein FALBO_10204 [Fusarium albosuccineum]|uniref:Uncharacterized protein n=1 Tax=Fusarium albosuccineum TaxID=1237068 RepID=A0A8H4PIL8_9HYPO|nr:hypothetical protein FALBO_10204 [Fusarium albosuccineum]
MPRTDVTFHPDNPLNVHAPLVPQDVRLWVNSALVGGPYLLLATENDCDIDADECFKHKARLRRYGDTHVALTALFAYNQQPMMIPFGRFRKNCAGLVEASSQSRDSIMQRNLQDRPDCKQYFLYNNPKTVKFAILGTSGASSVLPWASRQIHCVHLPTPGRKNLEFYTYLDELTYHDYDKDEDCNFPGPFEYADEQKTEVTLDYDPDREFGTHDSYTHEGFDLCLGAAKGTNLAYALKQTGSRPKTLDLIITEFIEANGLIRFGPSPKKLRDRRRDLTIDHMMAAYGDVLEAGQLTIYLGTDALQPHKYAEFTDPLGQTVEQLGEELAGHFGKQLAIQMIDTSNPRKFTRTGEPISLSPA